MVSSKYLTKQDAMDAIERKSFVNWLRHMMYVFKYPEEALFLGMNIFDRVIDRVPIKKDELLLYGVTSFNLAFKYVGPDEMTFKHISKITKGEYTYTQMKENEYRILSVIEGHLTIPTSLNFLEYFMILSQFDESGQTIATLILELSLDYVKFLLFKPSIIAAAICCIIRNVNSYKWTRFMEIHTRHTKDDLEKCIHAILLLLFQWKGDVRSPEKYTPVEKFIESDHFKYYQKIMRIKMNIMS